MKTINKLKSVISILIIFISLSCSKDDAPPSPNNPNNTVNQSPGNFNLLYPADGDVDTPLVPEFGWSASTDPDGDTVSYEMFLDNTADPSELQATTSKTETSNITTLEYATSYNWKVIASDGNGGSKESTIFGFTTKEFENPVPANGPSNLSVRFGHSSVVFKDKMWVIGGNGGSATMLLNDVWSGEDGITWGQSAANAPFQERWLHTSVVFDDKIWVIGGNSAGTNNHNDVWYSEDGAEWKNATMNAAFTPRYAHTSVVFDGKMWVIGGYDSTNSLNDVWYSDNGVDWFEVGNTPKFTPRYNHTSVVFNNKVWVMGGRYNSSEGLQDIWFSEDGVDWQLVTDEPDFGPLYYHAATVKDNLMWITGGFNGTSNVGDIWYSSNGINWKKAPVDADQSFSVRRLHTSLSYRDDITVTAGQTGNVELADTWFFE